MYTLPNRRLSAVSGLLFLCLWSGCSAPTSNDDTAGGGADRLDDGRWTPEYAHAWWAEQDLPFGFNYIPASAINQLEMWQVETYDPERIDLELGWAEEMGFNTVRVNTHPKRRPPEQATK